MLTHFLRSIVPTAICGWCLLSTETLAAQVTFNFEGPAIATEGPAATIVGDFVTGSVTFETNTPARDTRRPFDEGERLFYVDAITDLTFSVGNVTETFQSGDIQIFNDLSRCGFTTPSGCRRFLDEEDALFFLAENSALSAQLIVSGLDQDLLDVGTLPTTLPPIEEIFRVDFFVDDNINDEFSVSSNRIQLVGSSIEEIPTPALIPGLLGMGVAALRKRKQKAEL